MELTPVALSCALSEDLSYLDGSPVTDSQRFAADKLKEKIFSKFSDLDQGQLDKADAAAIAKFLLVNERCLQWNLQRAYSSSLWAAELIGTVKAELFEFFNPNGQEPLWSTYEEILTSARCGPGSNVGSSGNDFFTKMFSSNLTATRDGLYGAYRAICGRNPTWAAAERRRCAEGYTFQVAESSKLLTVPKNVDISRTICVEPSLNTFFQLGLADILTSRLRDRYGIDLSTQADVNRELARVGSLDDTICTIDLESASDSLSRPMMRWLIDRFHYDWFASLSCESTTLPDGSQVRLNMLSTMGNGFTFPLQTAIFCAVVRAAHRYLGVPWERAGKTWSVFGDDILCHRRLAGAVVDILEALGFSINQHKSFFEGPFRESCGRDFFRGRDVRPVYVKSLRTPQNRCTVINLLNRWSAMTGTTLPRTISLLLRTVRFTPVPPWENDDAGIKVPFSLVMGRLRKHPRFQSAIYYRYESRPLRLVVVDSTVRVPRGGKRRVFNPDGLLLAMLNGTLVHGSINIRHSVNIYRRRLAVAPSWDYAPALIGGVPAVPDFASEMERQRWRTAVELNMC